MDDDDIDHALQILEKGESVNYVMYAFSVTGSIDQNSVKMTMIKNLKVPLTNYIDYYAVE